MPLKNIVTDFVAALLEPEKGSVLKILNVNYCLAENGTEHHTSRYYIMRRDDGEAHLVVRRGQSFIIDVTISRDYDPNRDDIRIVFTAHDSKASRNRLYPVKTEVVQQNDVSNGAWRSEIQQIYTNHVLRIAVTPPANAAIGKWYMKIMTKTGCMNGWQTLQVDHPFYLLCNVWCRDDQVYLDNESERQEYVLRDYGAIWQGSAKGNTYTGWNYSQFDNCILDCANFLMTEIAELGSLSRGDPVSVTRKLCQVMRRIMEGNWSSNYEDGTAPWVWSGSSKILMEYYTYKTPVKYAQCWVFAGVLATIYRTLGLPCRVVTNFESPTDSDKNLIIDQVTDEYGNLVDGYKNEHLNIWNFHVWNEVWMKRPSSSRGPYFDGWQVLDGTYGNGPASVTGIKNGDFELPYDMPSVYTEINADLVWWRINSKTGDRACIGCDTSRVGQNISTKAVGKSNQRLDITHTYKDPEGSNKERDIYEKILFASGSDLAQLYLNKQDEIEDLIFNVELTEDLVFGQPFSVTLTISNVGQVETYQASANLFVQSIHYTRGMSRMVKQSDRTPKAIYPNTTVTEQLYISWEEYYPLLL